MQNFCLKIWQIQLKHLPLQSKSRKAHAKIAQLVEHNLAKVGVAGSNPVFRSNKLLSPLFNPHVCPGGGIGRRATLRG